MASRAVHRKPSVSLDTAARIVQAEAALARAYLAHLSALDETDPACWQEIVGSALKAGLTKEQLAESFACGVVTVVRWEAGLNVAAPMTRRAIKAELLAMLRAKAGSIEHHPANKVRLVKTGEVDAARRTRRLKA